MDYSIAISPDLGIDAEEFSAVWNEDPASRNIGRAEMTEESLEKYAVLDPEMIRQGLVFLGGVASTIAVDVLKDLIKERIKKIFSDRAGSKTTAPSIEIIMIPHRDRHMVIVKPRAEKS